MSKAAIDPRVAESFARQGLMRHLDAQLLEAQEGRCTIEVAAGAGLTQQHGFFHAGVTAAIGDTSGGYAAMTLMPPDASVLTIEFKINLIAPADGERLRACARVLRQGRTITTVAVRVEAMKGGRSIHELLGTMIAYRGQEER